mgnify:CR=1 FL=1
MSLPPNTLFLNDLPPLWATESLETDQITLPLRLSCCWHGLTWFPVERSDDLFFGLTLQTIPAWRHFHISELITRYHGHPVLLDKEHQPALAPEVPEIARSHLLDLSPFYPSEPFVP